MLASSNFDIDLHLSHPDIEEDLNNFPDIFNDDVRRII